MAERRMFAKTIIDSDAFLDMPLTAQALYFHLSMRADDDGFVNNPKKIQRMIGCGDDDIKVLISKRFILCFESGIIVIKHWRIHNYIQKDRKKSTVYSEEMKLLELKNDGAYTEKKHDDSIMDTDCTQLVSKMDTQVRLGKVSIGEDRRECDAHAPEQQNFQQSFQHIENHPNIRLTVEQFNELKSLDYSKTKKTLEAYLAILDERLSTGKTYKDHFLTLRKWAMQDGAVPNANNHSYDLEEIQRLIGG